MQVCWEKLNKYFEVEGSDMPTACECRYAGKFNEVFVVEGSDVPTACESRCVGRSSMSTLRWKVLTCLLRVNAGMLGEVQ